MELKDWLPIAVAVIGGITGCVALWQTRRSNTLQEQMAEANTRMADAAERANEIAGRDLDDQVAASIERVLPQLAVTYDGAVIRSAPKSEVRWVIESGGGDSYILRNIGTTTATGVKISGNDRDIARNLPQDAVIQPGASRQFLIVGSLGHPRPNEMLVRWNEAPEPTYVPMPPRRT